MTSTPSGFFAYPGTTPAAAEMTLHDENWARLLVAGKRLRLRDGDVLAPAGADDRALYVLIDGRVSDGARTVSAPATLGIAEFVGAGPRVGALVARGDGEALRLGFAAYERVAARDPQLGRFLLLELIRTLVGAPA